MVDVVPVWPVIDLRFEGESAVADAGVGLPVRVAVWPDRPSAAAEAAVAVAKRLGVERCRVRGVDPDTGGEAWFVVDVPSRSLEPLDVGGEGSASGSGWLAWVRRVGGGVPSRWWWVIALLVGAVIAVLVVVLVPRGGSAGVGGPRGEVSESPVAVVPPPAQLPEEAPTGWDTYAAWAVGTGAVSATPVAVLFDDDLLLLGAQKDVVGVDPRTGAERWRTPTGARVTKLGVLGGEVFAVHDRAGVTVLDAGSGKAQPVVEAPTGGVLRLGVGGRPWVEGPGQSGSVLVDGRFQARQVPAGAKAVGTVGEGLVSVHQVSGEVWVTDSNDPVLPNPHLLTPPSPGYGLGVAWEFVDGRLLSKWRPLKDGVIDQRATAGLLQIDVVDPRAGLTRVGSPIPLDGYSPLESDPTSPVVAFGEVLVDVRTGRHAQAPSEKYVGAPKLISRAGFGWGPSSEQRVRVSLDGEVVKMRSQVLPDLVLPDGRLLVRSRLGANQNGYFALDTTAPTPSPAPSPSR